MKEIKKYSSITSTCIMEFEKDASNKKVKKEYFMASRTRHVSECSEVCPIKK